MTRRERLRVRFGLGLRVAVVGILFSLTVFALSLWNWMELENERLREACVAEAAATEQAGLALLAGRLEAPAFELAAAVASARRAAVVQVDLHHDLRRRLRRTMEGPDLGALVRQELALTDLDAAWLRLPAGATDWLPRARVRGGPTVGPCLVLRPDGSVGLAACSEASAHHDGESVVAGGAQVVSLAGLPARARLVLRGEDGALTVLAASAETSVAAGEESRPGGLRRAGVAGLPGLELQVEERSAPRVVPHDLVAGLAGSSRASLRRHLQRTGALLGVALAAFALLGVALSRSFTRVLGLARRLGSGDLQARERLARTDEIGVLAAVLSDLGASLLASRGAFERAARAEAWRESARGIAHEIRNPLLPIRATLENLQRWRREEPARFEQAFDSRAAVILSEIEQLSRLAAALREAAATPAPATAPADLVALARGVASLQEAAVAGATVHVSAGEARVMAQVDAGQVRQVLTNLVQNAVQAQATRAAEVWIDVRSSAASDRIVVEDPWPGADDATLARLFDLGFTTRKGSGGSGLGLWLSRRLAEGHGGTLEVGRSGRGGLAFSLTLPRET